MKQIPLLICLLASFTTCAQLIVGDLNVNLLNEVKICEVIVKDKVMSKDIDVTFEYGQSRKAARYIIGLKKNKNKEFETISEVLNYMENNGWSYVNSITYYA